MHASVCETFDLRRVFFAPVSSVYFEGTGDCFPGSRVRVFGLWRVCFPPCLVRPGRRLPEQGLSEGSLGAA